MKHTDDPPPPTQDPWDSENRTVVRFLEGPMLDEVLRATFEIPEEYRP